MLIFSDFRSARKVARKVKGPIMFIIITQNSNGNNVKHVYAGGPTCFTKISQKGAF